MCVAVRSPYSPSFYDGQVDASLRSARVVAPLVAALVEPRSVIDIGCGRGGWLSIFAEGGVADIAGEDGPWVDPARMLIDAARFTHRDLAAPPAPLRRYDMAMSLEVAEHLDASAAQAFVDYLCALADTVLFSAAVPGQGGTHHVNEQRLSYWVDRFEAHDYALCDVLRGRIWDDRRIAWWYRQNMVLFAKRGSAAHKRLSRHPNLNAGPIDIIHPDGFFQKADLRTRFVTHPIFTLRRDLGAFSARIGLRARRRLAGQD